MKKINILKKIGEKSAVRSIGPRCFPELIYQPKPPAKIREAIEKNK